MQAWGPCLGSWNCFPISHWALAGTIKDSPDVVAQLQKMLSPLLFSIAGPGNWPAELLAVLS